MSIEKKYEMLKLAKETLQEGYKYKAANDHNAWLVNRHIAWVNEHRVLPHPPFPPFPTDEEIVKAASAMYNFVYSEDVIKPIEVLPVVVPVPAPVAKPEIVQPMVIQEGDFVFPQQEQIPIEPDPVLPEPVVEQELPTDEVKVPAETLSKGFLPGWIRRTLDNNVDK